MLLIRGDSLSSYVFNIEKKIWSRPGYAGIPYNDGDEAELRIAGIIETASDITVLSPELRQHCIDWPSLYHLSPTRANILRPFSAWLMGDILEIGAGCGAITRYLGESGADILALEGSSRRAAITRSRTRDLKNVMVLAENLDQFQTEHRFDVITLIGVLEYANLFTAGVTPALTMLERVRSLLKPGGKLIIAIENQLGLKYFAGAPEDHLGQSMYGIEGRYNMDQPQTFGRTVLAGLLKKAKFATVEFLAPFPDYKFPISILTSEGLSSDKFDGAAFAWQSAKRDPQLPSSTNFSLELAWSEIFKNRLALDMANSFLILASPLQQQIISPSTLGYHYSTDRIPQYCKETVFEYRNKNTIAVNYRMLYGNPLKDEIDQIITFNCPEEALYAEGAPLSLEFLKIVTRENWSVEEVGNFIQRYVKLLSIIAEHKGRTISTLRLIDKLPGDFFDVVPQNIIVDHSEQPIPIDAEWSINAEIELGWLLVRSLVLALGSGVIFARNSDGYFFSRRMFIMSVLEAAGYPLSNEDFRRYAMQESVIQQKVSGRSTQEFLIKWAEEPLLPDFKAEHCRQIVHLEELITERDNLITTLNGLVTERDLLVNTMRNSKSWRITRPLRAIARVFKYGRIR
jgi:SAM-dependent methyltransferase